MKAKVKDPEALILSNQGTACKIVKAKVKEYMDGHYIGDYDWYAGQIAEIVFSASGAHILLFDDGQRVAYANERIEIQEGA